MKPEIILLPASILVAAAIIATSLRPSPSDRYQALFGDGYVYVVDLETKNIANIIPGKTAPKASQ